jgi:hypothetical protein
MRTGPGDNDTFTGKTWQVWAFGDAAVMRSEHRPLHGKVLQVTRIFVKRDGRWQVAFGQQTTVE